MGANAGGPALGAAGISFRHPSRETFSSSRPVDAAESDSQWFALGEVGIISFLDAHAPTPDRWFSVYPLRLVQ